MKTKLLRLLREVRYKEIHELVGKKIAVSNLSSIRQELTDAIYALMHFGEGLELADEGLVGPLAKYGILDLRFATGQRVLSEPDKVSRKVLCELGFLMSKEDKEASREFEEKDPTCIEGLVERLAEKKEWLLVFLELAPRGDPILERFNATQHAIQTGVPVEEASTFALHQAIEALPARFPTKFKIIDACITNSDFIWFHKHFYL